VVIMWNPVLPQTHLLEVRWRALDPSALAPLGHLVCHCLRGCRLHTLLHAPKPLAHSLCCHAFHLNLCSGLYHVTDRFPFTWVGTCFH